MGNTCKTCINNDDGLCDRKGILVEDEDFCEHHWAAGKKIRMKRHEKKIDITPELMLSAYNTLIQFQAYTQLARMLFRLLQMDFQASISLCHISAGIGKVDL